MNGQDKTTTRRQGRVTLYHPNGKGTGAAVQLDMRINRGEETRYDCFFLAMAAQKSVAERGPDGNTPASFDWEHKITVKLGFTEIGEFIAVLEGRKEAAGKGRGIFHDSGSANTVVELKKAEDREGFSLSVSKKTGDQPPARAQMLLSDAEAAGLRAVLQTGLFFLMFHADMAEVLG